MKKISLGLTGKIVCLCLFIIISGVFIVLYGIYNTQSISEKYDHVAVINMPNLESLSQMIYHKTNMLFYLSKWQSSSNDADKKKVMESIESYEIADKVYQNVPFVEGEAELYKLVSDSWTQIKIPVLLVLQNKDEFSKIEVLSQYYDESLAKLMKFQDNQSKTWIANAKASALSGLRIQLFLLVLLLLFSLSISVYFGRLISFQVKNVTSRLEENFYTVSKNSGEVVLVSEELAETTSTQAASLEETTASLEEISSMIKMNAENSKNTSLFADRSKDIAEKGLSEVHNLINSMEKISKISQKISEIIEVIDDISFQTNILALNAAVEAARAGDQGKGFGVVADAVRSLAHKSSEASKEISDLIRENEGTVADGVRIATTSRQVFDQIVEDIKKVADLNREISSASEEQSTGLTQITLAMNQLDTSNQKSASTSDKCSKTANELSGQTESLKVSIEELTRILN